MESVPPESRPRFGGESQFPLDVYDRAYETGNPIDAKLDFANFREDLPDFLARLDTIMNEFTLTPFVEEKIISWCQDKRLVIIKSWRDLRADVLPKLELDATREYFVQHLALYEFRQLTSSSIAELEISSYPGYQKSWTVLTHPFLNIGLGHEMLLILVRYVRVTRLQTLLRDKPPEFDAGWYDALRPILHGLAPKLCSTLTPRQTWDLLSGGEFRFYERNEIVFEEGDAPDGYYVCLCGSVGIHKQPLLGSDDGDRSSGDRDDDHERKANNEGTAADEASLTARYGERLVVLMAGASFGEVGFSSHAKGRAATVVSLGDQNTLLSLEPPPPPQFTRAYDRTICYVVSGETFDLVFGERTKQFDAKVDTLKANYLYQHWDLEDLYKMAVRMQRKCVKPMQNITYPDHPEVAFIKRGTARIYKRGTKEDGFNFEVALVGTNDVFGVGEMVRSYAGGQRWAVAESETEAFVVSLPVARELTCANKISATIVAERAEARHHWESVCLASKEHVEITFEMMKYAKYSIHPDGPIELKERRRSPSKVVTREVTKDIEFAIQQTDKLLSAATTLEAEGSYVQAEEALIRCLEMCKDKIKKIRQMRREDGRYAPQQSLLARALRQRIAACNQRSIKATQLRVKDEMENGRMQRRGNVNTDDIVAKHALENINVANESGESEDSDDETEDSEEEEEEEDDLFDEENNILADPASTKSLAAMYVSHVPEVTEDMDPATRLRVRLQALEYALSMVTRDERQQEEAPRFPTERSASSVTSTSLPKARRQSKRVGFRQASADERSKRSETYTVLNHIEVTPLREVKRRKQSQIGSALRRSRALQESGSMLTLDQERRLGRYGLPAILGNSSTPCLHSTAMATQPVVSRSCARPNRQSTIKPAAIPTVKTQCPTFGGGGARTTMPKSATQVPRRKMLPNIP